MSDITSIKEFTLEYAKLNPTDRGLFYITHKEKLPSLIQDARDIGLLFSTFNHDLERQADFYSFMKVKNTFSILKTPQDINRLLTGITDLKILSTLKDEILPFMKDLQYPNQLDPKIYKTLLPLLDNKELIPLLTASSLHFGCLFPQLTSEKKEDIYPLLRSQLRSIITTPASLHHVLMHLSVTQQEDLCQNMKNDLLNILTKNIDSKVDFSTDEQMAMLKPLFSVILTNQIEKLNKNIRENISPQLARAKQKVLAEAEQLLEGSSVQAMIDHLEKNTETLSKHIETTLQTLGKTVASLGLIWIYRGIKAMMGLPSTNSMKALNFFKELSDPKKAEALPEQIKRAYK